MAPCICWKQSKTSSRMKNRLCSSLKAMRVATSLCFHQCMATLKLAGGNLDVSSDW